MGDFGCSARYLLCNLCIGIVLGVFINVLKNKKKIVVFFSAIALGIVVQQICANEPEKPSVGRSSKLFSNDPNYPLGSTRDFGRGELLRKTMVAVGLVIVFGAGAIYVSRKFLPKITNLPGKKVRIIETTNLGPRKAVHLLKIGDRYILVGSTNENVTRLGDVTEALTEVPKESNNS